MTWALDKQQAAQKVHTNYGERVTSPAPCPSPQLRTRSLRCRHSQEPLSKLLAKKLFGAAVAMLETSEIIKCFIKLVTGPTQPEESCSTFDTFSVLLANSRETYK